jgi:hypothetical protein
MLLSKLAQTVPMGQHAALQYAAPAGQQSPRRLLAQYLPLEQQVSPQHRSLGQHRVASAPQQVSSTPHTVKPQQARPGAWHSPPQHLPSTQVTPPLPAQPPQCLGSDPVSTHSPSHLTLPFWHFFLVHRQVVPSRDRLRLQVGTHAPWHLTVPAGHDSQVASAVTPCRRDRCLASRCAAAPTGQASTHWPSLQLWPSLQQFLAPHLVVPAGQKMHRKVPGTLSSQVASGPQQLASPHLVKSGAQGLMQ